MTLRPGQQTQGEIIKRRLDELGTNENAFAKEVGVTASFMYKVTGDVKRITTDERIQQVAELLRMDADPLYLSIDRLPPDVDEAIRRHPEMLGIIRAAAQRLDQKKGR